MSRPRNRRSTVSRRAVTAPPLLTALLRLGWHRVREHMAADVRSGEFADLQDAHLLVFQYPGPDGMRPSDLARQIRMSRQATNYLIVQLEGLGYLERRAGPDDDRRRVFATARGHRLLAAIRKSVDRFEARCERQAGSERFRNFVAVLTMIAGEAGGAMSGARGGLTSRPQVARRAPRRRKARRAR
jgi:DNA-binding MarR family transcriptional regulator